MKKLTGLILASMIVMPVYGQQMNTGTLVTVSGYADIKADNDQAIATFFIEEQDKDKAAAASRVNQKMKAGTDLIKKEDVQAQLATRGYYSYPIYSDETSSIPNQLRKRQQTGWRVGQYLEMKTQNLKQLPATAAAVQKTLALNGISFGLSDVAGKNLEAARLDAGYKNFSERVRVITKAMGRRDENIVIEALDFDGGDSSPRPYGVETAMMKSAMRGDVTVAETSFEPGVTSLTIRVIGKVRVK
ncbi:MAG: SIMPL domain-containing protein [Undibacterium sp.]|uniref:SIMPL domain-containing protein n=1 Tax=Undibacterium sp. TaxID=1914977 RepID=UPI0027255405|nr:SIMPL domain-containing protein [Undibacterium sp.]MDO8651198.1 SIMPL domain-containing protein [Undibacterium sp.]